jgi:hypothetical protein
MTDVYEWTGPTGVRFKQERSPAGTYYHDTTPAARLCGDQQSEGIMKAYHFSNGTLRGTGEPIVTGSIFHVDPPLQLCAHGLHGSVRAIDALGYSRGFVCSRVVHRGTIVRGDDKLCSTVREHIAVFDAREVVLAWARDEALRVVHLWDAPESVLAFLRTGEGEGEGAAYAAAYAARAAYAADVYPYADAAAAYAAAYAARAADAYTYADAAAAAGAAARAAARATEVTLADALTAANARLEAVL